MITTEQAFEREMNRFEREARAGALEDALRAAPARAPSADALNLHMHSFFSYNANGWSPTRLAWLARKSHWLAAGLVDFDVLDGLEEFLDAARRLGVRACGGLESRVFVPELAEVVINSPGEPGVAYHMGMGFTRAQPPPEAAAFLADMRAMAERRNRGMVERVNAFMRPVELDYERDVLPLTPAGNATERHICLAYAHKASKRFPDAVELAAFWTDKLGAAPDLPDGVALQNLIRSKTMKRGGVGYVQPDRDAFPLMADMNRFTLACGAVPTIAWLDGMSDGEQDPGRLLDIGMAQGAAALNIIPDRNYTPDAPDAKRENLYAIVEAARARDLPILVGTEMNSPGNKRVDDFQSDALRPLMPDFIRGAMLMHGHTVLQRALGAGFTSAWAVDRFPARAARKAFYENVGRLWPADRWAMEGVTDASIAPEALIKKLETP